MELASTVQGASRKPPQKGMGWSPNTKAATRSDHMREMAKHAAPSMKEATACQFGSRAGALDDACGGFDGSPLGHAADDGGSAVSAGGCAALPLSQAECQAAIARSIAGEDSCCAGEHVCSEARPLMAASVSARLVDADARHVSGEASVRRVGESAAFARVWAPETTASWLLTARSPARFSSKTQRSRSISLAASMWRTCPSMVVTCNADDLMSLVPIGLMWLCTRLSTPRGLSRCASISAKYCKESSRSATMCCASGGTKSSSAGPHRK